jgi:hypothetical protein
LDNKGKISVVQGRLEFGGSGSHTGTLQHATGSNIIFAGGNIEFKPSSTIGSGDGLEFRGANTQIKGKFLATYFEHIDGNTIIDNGEGLIQLQSISPEGGQLTFTDSIGMPYCCFT